MSGVTVADAIDLLRDPANRTRATGYCPVGHVEVSAPKVINELQTRGAADDAEARRLVVDGLKELGGKIRVERHSGEGTIQRAVSRVRYIDHFCVPETERE